MLPNKYKGASAPSASNAVADAWHNSLDPVTRAMVDPNYVREIARQSKICGVCRDLNLSHPMSTLTTTTINGKLAIRREATIDINGASWSARNIKDCGYCAMITDAIQMFCPSFFLGGWQLPRLESITLATDEPLLLTVADVATDGSGATERFGIEIYRDADARVPSNLRYVGVLPSGTDGKQHSRKQVTGRQIDPIKFIKESMSECATNHTRCHKKASRSRKLPTRILDLEALNDRSLGRGNDLASRSDLRLVITSTLPTSELESLSYAALSHSWGKKGIDFKLKKDNLKTFTDRISFSRVPATHKDAIVLARRLGFRYLWIDSLCIIQGFDEDTQTETAKMGDIYTNAELTIAAVSSGSSEIPFLALDDDTYTRSVPVKFYGARLPYHTRDILGSSGLRRTFLSPVLQKTTGATPAITLRARRTLRLAQTHAADNSASFNAPQGISDAVQGPLSLRAWTLQERALASRIVHFTAEGIKFECPTHLKSEDGKISSGNPGYCARWRELDSQRRKALTRETVNPRSPIADLLRTAHPDFYKMQPTLPVTVDMARLATLRNDIQTFWRTMLRDYTTRAITNRTDYLPALSGVAGRIQGMLTRIDDMKKSSNKNNITVASASRAAEPIPRKYVAGLWRDRLIEDLCWITQDAKWHKTPPIRADETDLPSWSWASINHPTVYPIINEKGTFIPHCEVVSCSTNLTESQWNEFGHVTSGEMILRGPVRKGKLTYTGQMNGGSGTVDFGMSASATFEEDARLISFEADVPSMTIAEERESSKLGQHPDFQDENATLRPRGSARKEKSWRRIIEGEQGKWDKAEVYCIKIGSWRPARSDLDSFMSGIDLDFIMVLGRSARVPGAFQRLGLLQKDYGGFKFDNVGDEIRKMEERDKLLDDCARITGTPVQPKTKEQIRMREELRNQWFYPEARVREMRIV